jgi:hypothetical protein
MEYEYLVQLISLGERKFDSALSNMALFAMADIETLFRTLPKLLRRAGTFVFSIMHPAFHNASSLHRMEEIDYDGEMRPQFSAKVSRYMSHYHAKGLARRNQVQPQMYFMRPLQYYLHLGFENGFVLDGFEERAFPPITHRHLPWAGKGNPACGDFENEREVIAIKIVRALDPGDF